MTTTIRRLDEERRRQGLTKAELARRCHLPTTTLRRLFSSRVTSDVKMSTVDKISRALGAVIDLKKIDDGLSADLSRELIARINRRHLAERLAARTGHDAGDIEHALYNLTLSPAEQLRRRFRGRQVHQRR